MSKCRYCDFYSQVGDGGLKHRYVTAAVRELKLKRDTLDNPSRSIFVGGGTPTSLGAGLLDELLGELNRSADANTEFTVEVNPGTIDTEMADVLVQNGVNRVSLGAQTFNPQLLGLKILGRTHNPQQTHEALRILRSSGVKNISLDLIYGIPGQTLDMWASDIDEALGAGVEHLSCYALSFEVNTPLWDDLNAHRVDVVDDELQREMYYSTIRHTESGGEGTSKNPILAESESLSGSTSSRKIENIDKYALFHVPCQPKKSSTLSSKAIIRGPLEQYEISNFARPGFQCVQNMTYWLNEGYLGIGPAAASYIDGTRSVNAPDLHDYLERLEQGVAPQCESEQLIGRAEMGETLMLALRLIRGVEIATFVERFGASPIDAFPRSFGRYMQTGSLTKTDTHIHLSSESLFTADTVLADILAEV